MTNATPTDELLAEAENESRALNRWATAVTDTAPLYPSTLLRFATLIDRLIAHVRELTAERDRLLRTSLNVEQVAESFNATVVTERDELKRENRNIKSRVAELEAELERLKEHQLKRSVEFIDTVATLEAENERLRRFRTL